MSKQWTGKSRQTDRRPELASQVLGNEVWVASPPGDLLRLSEMNLTELTNFILCGLLGEQMGVSWGP